jgi:hypothetical protein
LKIRLTASIAAVANAGSWIIVGSVLYGIELESKAVFHTYKRSSTRHVPATDIFIEGFSFIEETSKVCDVANIPVTDMFPVEKVSIEKKMSICQCVSLHTLAKNQHFTYP